MRVWTCVRRRNDSESTRMFKETTRERILSNCSTERRRARRWRRWRQQHHQLGQNQAVRRRFLHPWKRRSREPGTAAGVRDLRDFRYLSFMHHRRGDNRRSVCRSSLQVRIVDKIVAKMLILRAAVLFFLFFFFLRVARARTWWQWNLIAKADNSARKMTKRTRDVKYEGKEKLERKLFLSAHQAAISPATVTIFYCIYSQFRVELLK